MNDGAEAVPLVVQRWWENALLGGLVVSLFLHVTLALIAALILVGGSPQGDLGGGESAVGLASVTQTDLTEMAPASLSGGAAPVRSIAEEQTFKIDDLNSPFKGLGGAGEELGDVSGLSGAGSGGNGQGNEGDGLGLSGAGGDARFFGVEARGSRFAFIVDVSGSMMDPAKIGALKAALLESIDGMVEQASFCVVLFSTGALPLMGTQWVRSAEDQKNQAKRNISAISPSGGTNPLAAFDIIFALKPPPDAIYLMTDGVFSKEVEDALPTLIEQHQRESDTRTPIHCISFVDRGAEKIMRLIARRSGGSYTHVEGPKK